MNELKEIQERFVGQGLRDLRIRKNFSQRQLAEKVGVDPATISRYEKGSRTLQLNVVMNIFKVLEVSDSDVITTLSFNVIEDHDPFYGL